MQAFVYRNEALRLASLLLLITGGRFVRVAPQSELLSSELDSSALILQAITFLLNLTHIYFIAILKALAHTIITYKYS